MSITATVEAGKIVLPPGAPWPSGTLVRIEAVAEGVTETDKRELQPEDDPFLAAVLKAAKPRPHLSQDFTGNLDFYLHGGHKQKSQPGRWIPAGTAKREMTQAEADEFSDQMERLAQVIQGLPPDLADNHDHYLHGRPKR